MEFIVKQRICVAVAALALSLAAIPLPVMAQADELVSGKVTKVDQSAGKITIKHGALKKFDMEDGTTMVCAAGHGGSVAIDPPPLIFVSLQRRYQRVFWLEATDTRPFIRVGSNAQARAPPSFS
jgi:hypothetical protein